MTSLSAQQLPWVYAFTNGDGNNKSLLGGKGANLCSMTQLGLNVPTGFIISTQACLHMLDSPQKILPEDLMTTVRAHIVQLEKETGKQFGGTENPLLVSVRSGAALSMPGMMDTILNLGLNATTTEALIKKTQNPRFGYDARRRFIQLFGEISLGISKDPVHDKTPFEALLDTTKREAGAKQDVDLSVDDLKTLCQGFLAIVEKYTGTPFPEDPFVQLECAIRAVFSSWDSKRAIAYRQQFHITDDMANGTAVTIQAMVFGNMGQDSATGVAFTRDPSSGENCFFGEYLVNAQGEDVVAGIRTPKAIQKLQQEMPALYDELQTLRSKLESHYHEVQDFEFTIEQGILYCLQTRNGKMNTAAMVRTSVEMVEEGLINQARALLRINPEALEQLLFPQLPLNHQHRPICGGIGASPGAACGRIVFDADSAVRWEQRGERVILLRQETKPEDIHGFFAATGILTSRGGRTSHAAVVARGMGKPCIVGAENIHIDLVNRRAQLDSRVLVEGDTLTLDGSNGHVYSGEITTVEPKFSQQLHTLLGWADATAHLQVMANSDTPKNAQRALEYGAMGIGLCRTERMFNEADRLPLVVDMIVANNQTERTAALERLMPIQRNDFKELMSVMAPRPVTIRLLDPPIHEFLPSEQQLQQDINHLTHLQNTFSGVQALHQTLPNDFPAGLEMLCQNDGQRLLHEALDKKQLMLQKVRDLHEVNPMLGHRGVRLGISYPDIYRMQIQAILEATAECIHEGLSVTPEIMAPQVCTRQELLAVRQQLDSVHQTLEARYNIPIPFRFGSMLEVVRACLRAETLAEVAEFFSFGTNDLTQATYSFSREDAENKFLPDYLEQKILKDNPFDLLDVHGVGKLMEWATVAGRKTRPELKIGICGEQGGHPATIHFCHQLGLSYVSCSAPRVPIARLAAAHAALKAGEVC